MFKTSVYQEKIFLILSNKDLELRGKTYCVFCSKSYKHFMLHHCREEKCPMCFKYTFENEYSSIVCKTKTGDFAKQCDTCLKTSYDEDCYSRHTKLSTTHCKLISLCQFCNVYFRKEHVCNMTKCATCFLHHPREHFCNIRVKRYFKEEPTSFFLTKINDCVMVAHLNNPGVPGFTFMFDLQQQKAFIFESYGDMIPPYPYNCILEEFCYVKGLVKKIQ